MQLISPFWHNRLNSWFLLHCLIERYVMRLSITQCGYILYWCTNDNHVKQEMNFPNFTIIDNTLTYIRMTHTFLCRNQNSISLNVTENSHLLAQSISSYLLYIFTHFALNKKILNSQQQTALEKCKLHMVKVFFLFLTHSKNNINK